MTRQQLVVIGNGMAGARLVENIVSGDGAKPFDITVFGEEPHGNYNRILLSGVLAGTHRADDIMINAHSWYARHGVTLRAGVRVNRVDLGRRVVGGADGSEAPYDSLVFATGSRPLLPPIEGLRDEAGGLRHGVFVFRTIDDCDAIVKQARHVRRAVVIGGGLLGLEAARGLASLGLDVQVIHLTGHLMDAQLDRTGGQILRRQLEQSGLKVRTGTSTTAIQGNGHVTGVAFSDGSALECELVVVAAGIRPNVELAREAGVEVRRGIVVEDNLECPGFAGVHAVGECAEHRGKMYGLVAPLWEQASVLADRLTGRNASATYSGSRTSTKLKVAGIDLAVMGLSEPSEDDDEVVTYTESSRGIYKKLIVRNNTLAGAIVIGDAGIVPTLTQAFNEATPLSEMRSEVLFPGLPDVSLPSPEQIPNSAQICDCNSVSKGEIVEAVFKGARSLQAVCDATRASTGCGACRPEVQRIVDLACAGMAQPTLLNAPAAIAEEVLSPEAAHPEAVVVTLNKIERLKQEKDGLDILPEVPALAAGAWQAIDEGDRERLKWGGVFFRRQTPGQFMMRVRISNGLTNAEQMQAVAGISQEFGTGLIDITTRQQLQIRGFDIGHLPEIWNRLDRVGLVSLQTGMDNIRNVIGCAMAGLTPTELVDAAPIVQEFTEAFLRNKAYTNLPRKFNVGISGCTEHCTHGESQDLSLTPAVQEETAGFNVAIGGKMGSGGCRVATPLDIFVEPGEAAALCEAIVLLFRDHGSRAARNKARLSFLLESWGVTRFRREVEQRVGRSLPRAGRDARGAKGTDHLGIMRQKQTGLHAVGLAVPVGRVSASTLAELARVASAFGNGEIRLTTSQNVIIPNVPDTRIPALIEEPLLTELPYNPHGVMRGLVACTGIDYCHLALIETKDVAMRTAQHLTTVLPHGRRLTMHWSGCPAGCGNHAMADIGLLGKNVRVGNEIIEAVDVFVGGRAGPSPKAGIKVFEDIPVTELPEVLEGVIPWLSGRVRATS